MPKTIDKLPKLKDHCEMCGAREGTVLAERKFVPLQVALDPDRKLQTLCGDCRDGSMMLIADSPDHLSAVMDAMDQLAEYLKEAHQEEIDEDHAGDGASGCSYCDALKEADQVRREVLNLPARDERGCYNCDADQPIVEDDGESYCFICGSTDIEKGGQS